MCAVSRPCSLPRVHPMCGAITRLCRRSRPLGHDRVQATAHGPEELARGAAWPRASPSSSCASLSLSLSLMCAATITVCVPHARLCLMSYFPAPSCRFAVTGYSCQNAPLPAGVRRPAAHLTRPCRGEAAGRRDRARVGAAGPRSHRGGGRGGTQERAAVPGRSLKQE